LTASRPRDIIKKKQEVTEMKNYLFYDDISGEQFIVEAETQEDAIAIACQYYDDPQLDDVITDIEAEMLGYDTY